MFAALLLTLASAERPNVVVILADDMGFSDIGCYGGEIPTPNIDRLAAEGLRYTRFYNTGRCCPTRASILTGQYAHAVGVGHMTGDLGPETPAYRGHLNDRCATFGRILRDAGYATIHTGKWHVGSATAAMRPNARGFDRFYGVPEGGGFYYRTKPGRTVRLDERTVFDPDNQPPADWYSTDAWTDYAVRFIDEAVAADKPFCVYLAHNAPHFPLQADAETIAKYRGQFLDGWDVLRDRRLERQKASGLLADTVELAPRPDNVKPWSETTPRERNRFDHVMACYAATVDLMDQSIGRLMQSLEDRGVADDTLVLFLSDNGASAEGGVYGKLEGDRPGDAASSVFAGRAWATLSNSPFRRHKKSSHEGGIRTPLVVRWPSGIAARGEDRPDVGHVIDVLPTLLDVAGVAYPESVGGRSLRKPDGVSLLNTFDSPQDRDRVLFWSHEGNEAVRDGDLKLVRGWKEPWRLYDLAADPTELNDLSDERPRQVEGLRRLQRGWSQSLGADWKTVLASRKKK